MPSARRLPSRHGTWSLLVQCNTTESELSAKCKEAAKQVWGLFAAFGDLLSNQAWGLFAAFDGLLIRKAAIQCVLDVRF